MMDHTKEVWVRTYFYIQYKSLTFLLTYCVLRFSSLPFLTSVTVSLSVQHRYPANAQKKTEVSEISSTTLTSLRSLLLLTERNASHDLKASYI